MEGRLLKSRTQFHSPAVIILIWAAASVASPCNTRGRMCADSSEARDVTWKLSYIWTAPSIPEIQNASPSLENPILFFFLVFRRSLRDTEYRGSELAFHQLHGPTDNRCSLDNLPRNGSDTVAIHPPPSERIRSVCDLLLLPCKRHARDEPSA